jgi:hypothetical protein
MANVAEHGARMFFVHIEIRGMRDSEYNRDRIDGALHTVGLSGFTQAADGRVLRLPGNLYVGQFESARAAADAAEASLTRADLRDPHVLASAVTEWAETGLLEMESEPADVGEGPGPRRG